MKGNQKSPPLTLMAPSAAMQAGVELLESAGTLVLANLVSSFVDLGLGGAEDALIGQGVRTGAFVAVFCALIFLLRCLSSLWSRRQRQRFYEAVYRGALRQDCAAVERLGVGGVKERLAQDMTGLGDAAAQTLPGLAASAATALGFLCYLAALHWPLALLFALLSLLKLVPPLVVKKFIEKNYAAAREISERWMDHINQASKGLLTIKACGLKGWYLRSLEAINGKALRTYVEKFRHICKQDLLKNSAGMFVTYGGYILTGLFYFWGSLTLGGAAQVLVIASRFFSAADGIFSGLFSLFVFPQMRERVSALMGDDAPGDPLRVPGDGSVFHIDNLSFSYGERPVLKNFCLDVRRGDKVLVQGPNGSGKSTLLRILLGLERGYTGAVTFLGRPAQELTEAQILESLCYLPQADAVLDLTVGELTGLCAGTSGVFGAGERLPRGEAMKGLSGGELKQLLTDLFLGRERDILVLDEPSNSLDAAAVETLLRFLRETEKTVIVISHDVRLTGFQNKTVEMEGQVAAL